MNKRTIGILLFIVLGFALLADLTELLGNPLVIKRGKAGEHAKDYRYELNARDTEEGSLILKDYSYTVQVASKQYEEEEEKKLYQKAEEEIAEGILGKNASLDHVTENLKVEKTYCKGKVTANWKFVPEGYLSEEGRIYDRELPLEGILMEAQVTLQVSDGKRKEVYYLPFKLYPRELTKEERLLSEIKGSLEEEAMQSKQGEEVILPEAIAGVKLNWKRKRSHYTIKILAFALIIGILLQLREVENRGQLKKKRAVSLQRDYSDMIGKFAIMAASGMTIQQSFRRVIEIYEKNKKDRPVCEELNLTLSQIREGESERKAYEALGERVGLADYRRFVRLILQQQKKGNASFVEELNHEVEQAYRDRRVALRKQAEELGTLLLLPMMVMLGVVLVIVMMPAFMTMRL